jgi:hypothetical protein
MEPAHLKRYIAQTVQSAESGFERLVFLGSLRDAYTGQYLHQGWPQIGAADEIHGLLRKFHQAVFEAVLHLPLAELAKELRLHFHSLSYPERQTAFLWLEIEPFRDLIPQGCSTLLRELFVSQIRTALEVLRHAPEWEELMGPLASPHFPPDRSPLFHWLN